MNETFDFFHIDGHHDNEYITTEFKYIEKLNKSDSNILKVIFDDQNCMSKLQNYILNNYKIIKNIIPNCAWNNVYFEIQL